MSDLRNPIPSSSPCAPPASLRSRLLDRVHASHVQQSRFTTIRREQGRWLPLQAGVETKTLFRRADVESVLLRLAPGVVYAPAAQPAQCEAVVLSGHLALDAITLDAGEVLAAPLDAGAGLRAGGDGALLFLRLAASIADDSGSCRFNARVDDEHWRDLAPGVRVRQIWHRAGERAVIARMLPGSKIGEHPHGLDEECIMLDGEVFVGDTLVRSHDYHFAPQGSHHGELTTDVGGLFYVRGALSRAAALFAG